LSLVQIDAIGFVNLSEELLIQVDRKKYLKSAYSQQTKIVAKLSKEIHQNGKILKNYLFEHLGKTSKEHYTAFGFLHRQNQYLFPRDNDKLVFALRLICMNINSGDYAFLQNQKYGKQYWEQICHDFQTAWGTARQQAADLSDLTRDIQKNLSQVKKILGLLHRRIKDDFAPDHRSYWQSIGFIPNAL
jgi:hypothetical protein